MSIILAVIVFGVVVLVHEWGHFIAARKCGILVEEFAIGMGPVICRFGKGETQYSLRLFPIGGFCRMLGEDDANDDIRSFNNKKVWQRIVVISAGVVMNFFLALLVIFLLLSTGYFSQPVIKEFMPDAPAQAAGLLPGDEIIKINGRRIHLFEEMLFEINDKQGAALDFTVQRGKEKFDVTMTPVMGEKQNYAIGVVVEAKVGMWAKNPGDYEVAGFFETIRQSFYNTIFYVRMTLVGLVRIVTANISVGELSGPIGVVQIMGEYSQDAIENVEITGLTSSQVVWNQAIALVRIAGSFIVLISANLAVFNLLPIPALDGGRLVFLLIEGVRGRPISPEKEGMVHLIGFFLLIGLAIFVAYSDIRKLTG